MYVHLLLLKLQIKRDIVMYHVSDKMDEMRRKSSE